MRVCDWYIFDYKTRLFWSNELGWVGESSATSFSTKDKEQIRHLPQGGAWLPNVSASFRTTDELIEHLKLFPSGTPLTGNVEDVGRRFNVKVFGMLLDQTTMEDRESGEAEDNGENAKMFAMIFLD